jgi:hypothetical protein
MFMNACPDARPSGYHGIRRAERAFLRALRLGVAMTVLTLPAAAQQAQREGEIEFTFSADVRDVMMIPAGATAQASLVEVSLVITETVSGPMERMGARCVALGRFDTKSQEWGGRGNCTWQDADGDKIFETLEDSGAGGAGAGKATITGGTGKFAGITGGYDYTLEFAASPDEGHTQWVGHKKGTWRILTD